LTELTRAAVPAGGPAAPTIDDAAAATDRRLVATLRERYERLLTADGTRARPFELRLPGGGRWPIGEGEPSFTVTAVTESGRSALAALDELAVAEAYMTGDLDIEGDLLTALKARPILGDRHPLKYLWATYFQPLLRGQAASDKRWIGSHYDVDPGFFVLWLDDKLRGYSHGFFERDDEPLEVGMERKFRYAFDACGIRPGQRVLDIGGGWGSFLEFAGEQGVRVTSITISEESEEWMKELIVRRGLDGCEVVKEHFLEYRPRRRFDAIVNLGVTEHLPDYRRSLAQYRRLLEPGRRVYLDAYSGKKHRMPSFISKWVFEGNTSPLCLREYLAEVARTPFEVVLVRNDRHNYFLTCKKWAENLQAKHDEVVSRWGEHLYRRFVLYLWSAANSFETGTLSAHRMILQLPSPDGARRAAVEAW
jgi:cyclopropane-fatty-acyl-phospholipid synthase